MPKPSDTTQYLRNLRRSIGVSIHEARMKQRMPLSKLSQLTGIPVWKLDFFELGKGEIGLEDVVKVGFVLGLVRPFSFDNFI